MGNSTESGFAGGYVHGSATVLESASKPSSLIIETVAAVSKTASNARSAAGNLLFSTVSTAQSSACEFLLLTA